MARFSRWRKRRARVPEETNAERVPQQVPGNTPPAPEDTESGANTSSTATSPTPLVSAYDTAPSTPESADASEDFTLAPIEADTDVATAAASHAPLQPPLDNPPPATAFVDARDGQSAQSAAVDAEYLARLMSMGGDAVIAYKTHSFSLLHLSPGMTVVDVGCGPGGDLPALVELVRPDGRVIGIEKSAELARRAQTELAEAGLEAFVTVLCEDGEALSLADASVDAIRADRALQYFPHPERALAEMWRVLRPGGRVAVVEPDWKLLGIDPGSAAGQNDDSALDRLLWWYQREWPQPLIGRRLFGMLRAMGDHCWSELHIQPIAFPVTDWRLVDSIVEVRETAAAIVRDDPSQREVMEGWLAALDAADRQGTFFAILPLVVATARKADLDAE
jgi:ubiquinone/menaquinone biosynthesis C-methylase UbiE